MPTPFVCHAEWESPETANLEKHLSQLFGWQFRPFAPGYLIYIPRGGTVSVGIRRSDEMRSGGSFAFISAPDGNLIGLQQI